MVTTPRLLVTNGVLRFSKISEIASVMSVCPCLDCWYLTESGRFQLFLHSEQYVGMAISHDYRCFWSGSLAKKFSIGRSAKVSWEPRFCA